MHKPKLEPVKERPASEGVVSKGKGQAHHHHGLHHAPHRHVVPVRLRATKHALGEIIFPNVWSTKEMKA
jgi:hypothetical protein